MRAQGADTVAKGNRGDGIRERSLIGEKIGLSESEGFSGLCFGKRDDVAEAM